MARSLIRYMVLATLVATAGWLPGASHAAEGEQANPVAAAAASVAQAPDRRSVTTPTAADRQELAAGNNRFALDLYAQLKGDGKANLFFSPFSIRTALAMAYAGARGETAAQMRKALAFTLEDAKLHGAFGESIRRLNQGGKAKYYEMAVANSMWGERTHTFLEAFLDLNRACYGGGLERADFLTAAEPARQRINLWVEDRTRQKVKDLIPPRGVDAGTRLVLVNAVYFKGDWATPFRKEDTTEQPFGLLSAGPHTGACVPLMHRTAEYRYAEVRLVEHPATETGRDHGMVQVLELPYAGDTVSMVVLLPHANALLSGLEAELSAATVRSALAALGTRKVEVYLPRFRMTWGTEDLGSGGIAALPGLGMVEPFDDRKADFSGMDGRRPAAAGGLYVGAVFHKAFVDVNEEGTEAAAATAVVMAPGGVPAPPPVFRADRPFLFLIREKPTGAILFMGRVMKPGSSPTP